MNWTFFAWIVLMVALVVVYFFKGRRARTVEGVTEDIAAQALPTIGRIAERQHTLRFGRPPTSTPGPEGTSEWYPPSRKHRRQRA